MGIEDKLQSAYDYFKNTVSQEEHKNFLSLIKNIHQDALHVIDGKKSHLHRSEFALALSRLEPSLSEKNILPADFEKASAEVLSDGSLLGCGTWELLDEGWLGALIGWMEHIEDHAPFNSNPPRIKIPDKVGLCIAGDWGTGYWRNYPISPAQAVGEQMLALESDINLHLGDVYYAGTKQQEENNLINIWPEANLGIYTLNSNHEMYNGAYSYYHALHTRFSYQQGCSYFALENDNWLIIGLDTAYHSDKWNLYMDGALGEDQINWLKSLPTKQGIIIASHHTGFNLEGSDITSLYGEVMQALDDETLGNCRYDNVYWYWGHAHNAVVYNDRKLPCTTLRTRCIGHAAIPYGNALKLETASQVSWYETQLAGDLDIPNRVLCGFAHIELDSKNLNESLIGEDGSIRWEP